MVALEGPLTPLSLVASEPENASEGVRAALYFPHWAPPAALDFPHWAPPAALGARATVTLRTLPLAYDYY